MYSPCEVVLDSLLPFRYPIQMANQVRKQQQKKGNRRPPQPRRPQANRRPRNVPLARTINTSNVTRINYSKSIKLQHTEVMGLESTTNDGLWVWPNRLSPTNSSLTNWGAGIANNYDRYRYDYIRIRYSPRVAATASGFVRISIDSDVLDSPPKTMQQLSYMAASVEGPVWSPMTLNVPPNLLNKILYTGEHNLADMKSYFVGMLYTAIQGYTGSPGIFEIEYSVTLMDPSLPDVDAGEIDLSSAGRAIAANTSGIALGTFPTVDRNDPWVPVTILFNSMASDISGAPGVATTIFQFTRDFIGTIDILAFDAAQQDWHSLVTYHNTSRFDPYQSSSASSHTANSSFSVYAKKGEKFTMKITNSDLGLSQTAPESYSIKFLPLTTTGFTQLFGV